MAIHRPTYATRRMVKFATDIAVTAEYDTQVDSALESAADEVDSLCHRRFYNVADTAFFDWPNFQRAYPWRIWLEEKELATVTAPVPVVTSGGTVIPAGSLLWGPWNYAPPFRKVEINRSTSASFGLGTTPQRDVAITGLFGYWTRIRPAGTLAAAITDTTTTTITVSDSSQLDAGDVLTVDSETMLVTDYAFTTTGQTQLAGCSTTSSADNQLTVANGAALHQGEIIQLDGERMFITSITGNVATVQRSYDGSVLATHSGGVTVNALRLLTVTRGDFGSTAASHLNTAAITAALVPGDVRELSTAEALNTVYQKVSAYARAIGENQRPVPGGSLPDLRDRVLRGFGRKARSKVV